MYDEIMSGKGPKPGYAGYDAMREKAEKALGTETNSLDKHRKFAKGGSVKMKGSSQAPLAIQKRMVSLGMKKGGKVKPCATVKMKMAAGGVAKIRHKEATPSGMPMKAPKHIKKGFK